MKKEIIGAVHLSPMPGYKDYPGFDVALENALFDARAFIDGGVTGLIIENNYDIPHKEQVDEVVIKEMISIGKEIRKITNLPIGVSVLWNDYKSAFLIAKEIDGSFIRVPVFVDDVKTSYGVFHAKADDVLKTRQELGLNNIKIYADIHVKHAVIVSKYSIEESAQLAIKKGADVLIVTGKWTGDSPDLNDLIKVRKVLPNTKIICGSGVDVNNVKSLFEIADGAIISTSLKDDSTEIHEQNIKPYNVRINKDRVVKLVEKVSH